ncbi:acyl-CoA dehydrogenase family protein [Nocardioides sp. Y6]|uniref:Acyl-CoA dehydrogenase family protein n=1 Tax=Nocardioides malaquae TaxID=2773426 RepID=A0ABR9RTH1_9ACTN|nr:acyl-CoA dehydrogenase family protein [Nocardioides malaquae]MBE7324420.1 acyl-CoA dehydrogenase family protein [Nocardioides malaquae]
MASPSSRRPAPGRATGHGLASTEKRAPIGYAVAALNKLAQSDVLDRLGLRERTERIVHGATSNGFRSMAAVSRAFSRKGSAEAGVRPAPANPAGVFDLTPSEDEQMLVDVVREYAREVLAPNAAEADDSCTTSDVVLKASVEIGLPILGLPESVGGISEERSAMTGALVAEALSQGDMGQALAVLAPGSVATAIGLWGTDEQQQTYLPAFTGDDVAAAAVALAEPMVLFDAMTPATRATRTDDGFTLDGVKSAVVRGAEAELFVVGALLDDRPALFLVESSAAGLTVEADPSMGVRAAGLTKISLDGTPAQLLGDSEGRAYADCVRLARVGWCALAVGTAQSVLDYVTDYVKTREAFGEPIAHRQSVAFMVADIAIELQAMRLLTWRAASRAAQGKDFAREVALARRLCAEKGMKIGLDGVQLLGGHGFVKEHPVERWYRDLRAVGVMEGAVLV